jgi:hypothetical protein
MFNVVLMELPSSYAQSLHRKYALVKGQCEQGKFLRFGFSFGMIRSILFILHSILRWFDSLLRRMFSLP